MLAPSSEGVFYCLRSCVSDACPFLNPICRLPLWASCPWEARLLVRAVALIPSGKKGLRRGGAHRLRRVSRCVVIAAKHQGSSAGIWAQDWLIRAFVLCRRIGALASDDIPLLGGRPRPLRGWPWWPHVDTASHPSPCTGTRQRAGECQKGKWAGSLGSMGADTTPASRPGVVPEERSILHGRQRSGGR